MNKLSVECFGGNCPIQAEGSLGNLCWYFRSRGDRMQLRIAESDADLFTARAWWHAEPYGVYPDAGWAPISECKEFMLRAFQKYAKDSKEELDLSALT